MGTYSYGKFFHFILIRGVFISDLESLRLLITIKFCIRNLSLKHIDFTDYHMIIRKPVLEVLKSIKKMKEGEKPPRFVFCIL